MTERRFYTKLLWEVVRSFGKAVYKAPGMVAIFTFAVLSLNRPLGQIILGSEWEGISPHWAWVLVGVLTIILFLKAIYKNHCELEQRKNKEITDLHNTTDKEITDLRNTIDSVRDIKTELEKMVGSDYSTEWQSTVRIMLQMTLPSKCLRVFDEALCGPNPEVCAKACLRILVARIDGSVLREARLEKG